MTQNIPFTLSDKTISVFLDGKPHTFDNSFPQFAELSEALKGEHDLDEIRGLITIPKYIEGKSFGHVVVADDAVYYKGKPVHNHLTERLLAMISDGYDIAPWAMFMDRLMSNPDTSSRDQLYIFLEKSLLPITPDGYFLAYKRVREDYTDIHSGKFDNSVGKTPSMPRKDCDNNREVTCSRGLHFCSEGYLSSYGSGSHRRTMVVKVDPKDVVSIPKDHNDAKGRACRYEVVGELGRTDRITSKPVEEKFPSKAKKKEKSPEKAQTLEPVFEHNNCRTVKASRILELLEKHQSQATLARTLGLPNSTLKGWVKKAKAWKNEQYSKVRFGDGFTVQQVLDAKTRHGTTAQAAKALKVAKSTYRGWLKKAQALN